MCRSADRCFIIVVLTIIAFGYFSYIYLVVIPWGFYGSIFGWFNLLGMHLVIGLLLVSYFKTVATEPGYVPKDWVPPNATKELLDEAKVFKESAHKTRKLLPLNAVRYCLYCNAFKPPRSHHCRECSKCIMKMDHHCPWVNNCVGFRNHKTFILFLFYAVIALTWLLILLAWRLVEALINHTGKVDELPFGSVEFLMFFGNFILTLPITLAILSLFIYQVMLVKDNLTSIETFHKQRFIRHSKSLGENKKYQWDYDFGASYNMRSLFGKSYWEWFIPNISYEGDGLIWRSRAEEKDLLEGDQSPHVTLKVPEAEHTNITNLNKRNAHVSP